MRVKELIRKLQRLDQMAEVVVNNKYWDDESVREAVRVKQHLANATEDGYQLSSEGVIVVVEIA